MRDRPGHKRHSLALTCVNDCLLGGDVSDEDLKKPVHSLHEQVSGMRRAVLCALALECVTDEVRGEHGACLSIDFEVKYPAAVRVGGAMPA
jgi:hypothetical protein